MQGVAVMWGPPARGAAESNHAESCFEGTKTEAVGLAGGDEREGTGVSCAHVPGLRRKSPALDCRSKVLGDDVMTTPVK